MKPQKLKETLIEHAARDALWHGQALRLCGHHPRFGNGVIRYPQKAEASLRISGVVAKDEESDIPCPSISLVVDAGRPRCVE
jgi:hypothetical protein